MSRTARDLRSASSALRHLTDADDRRRTLHLAERLERHAEQLERDEDANEGMVINNLEEVPDE
jgi:hypothetical protein